MKSKEQKRKEAIERADETYSRAEAFNWRLFLDRYPERSDYLRLFRARRSQGCSVDIKEQCGLY